MTYTINNSSMVKMFYSEMSSLTAGKVLSILDLIGKLIMTVYMALTFLLRIGTDNVVYLAIYSSLLLMVFVGVNGYFSNNRVCMYVYIVENILHVIFNIVLIIILSDFCYLLPILFAIANLIILYRVLSKSSSIPEEQYV